MKKVGLCLAYSGTNYGQNLQAYATQYVIDSYGFITEIIDYRSGQNKGLTLSYATLVVASKKASNLILRRITKREKKQQLDNQHLLNAAERKKQADLFRKQRLHGFVRCDGIKQLQKKSCEYAAVVVGSDQIWLPGVAVTNFYTLRFAAPGVTRISYATSMGVSSYPTWAKKPAAEFWKKIDFLSVREQQAKEIIQATCNADVKMVADPTYLLTKEQWIECIPLRKVVEDGYVLCYLLGNSASIKAFCRRFADEKKLRLVGIMSDECNSNDADYCDEVIIGKGPEDFINLIRNANYVMTDSFHGLAFSIINEKQFSVFYRKREDTKESRNSRIDNIVKMWGVEKNLIANPQEAEIMCPNIDYQAVNQRREQLRAESLAFLEAALGIDKGQNNDSV